jgi:putative hydrolase of the HAD superfamily
MFRNADLEREWTARHGRRGGYADAVVSGAVLFDRDGTLIDHRAAAAIALRTSLEYSGQVDSVELAKLEVRWFFLERSHMDVFLAGECTFVEQRRRRLREFLPELGIAPGSDSELDAWFAYYASIYEANWAPYGDVEACPAELLTSESPPKLGVLTNGEHEQQCAKVDRCNLRKYFAEVLVSDDLGYAKPASECFVEACRRLRVAPQDTVYVGDMVNIDARAAAAAGLCGVWLDRHGTKSDDYQPRVESLAELPALVAGRCWASRGPK